MAENTTKPNLMPWPRSVTLTGNNYTITKDFSFALKGPASQRLNDYSARFLRRLAGRTGLFLVQKYVSPDSVIANPVLTATYDSIAPLSISMNESYTLSVKASGIQLHAVSDIGIMRGLETLLQLFTAVNKEFIFTGAEISDFPRFTWRGLMIDCSRHFMPVSVLKRNIDGMAAVKLNVFHWHLTDDQGFRVECKSFPALHEKGSDGNYFTHEQVREVIAYANARGIRVVPEFDIPGHTTSWVVSFPEFASAPGPYQIERKWGVFNPTLNPVNEDLYVFFDKFFAEMRELFNDAYIHIGGDENNGKQWNNNQQIKDFITANNLKDNHGLQTWFSKRIQQLLVKHNFIMMGWDEILHPDLPKNIVVHSWRGMKYLENAAKQGYMTVLSNGYYIDLCYHASTHYLVDPAPDSLNLSPAEQKNILGGEATMWAELITPETIDSRIWPRTAAIAERFWSAKEIRDVNDMYKRLLPVSLRLEELGLLHYANRDMMMRRVTNGQPTDALSLLVGILEPIKGYTRHHEKQSFITISPYTRLADICAPESDFGREFAYTVEKYLSGNLQAAAELPRMLAAFEEIPDILALQAEQAPMLNEILPAADNMKALAKLLHQFMHDKKAPAEAKDIIEKARKPVAETTPAILESMEKLLNLTR
ncbi:MAG: family 20 glycosylhydrolase [Ignavibacteria bacterium]|nr:family 20 glycosylhydrolase [Ignavibacteria bacterium]